jgi:hypothetical protein
MMKSARVTLTVLAGIGAAAHAQTGSNPCAPGGFNPAACQAAVKSHGYCDNAAWVQQKFQNYPYYYDLYQAYGAAGGVVSPVTPSTCRVVRRGGFGALGFRAHGHGG